MTSRLLVGVTPPPTAVSPVWQFASMFSFGEPDAVLTVTFVNPETPGRPCGP
jgi:hypothetical protein